MPDTKTPLDPARARQLAEGLAGIRNFPRRHERPVIDRCAELLLKLCQGDAAHSPEEQAEWLIAEAIEQMEQWNGYSGLRALYRSRFDKAPERPEFRAFEGMERPPTLCTICNDQGVQKTAAGWVRCVCEAGPNVPPEYLAVLNKHGPVPARKHATPQEIERELEQLKEKQRQNQKRKGTTDPHATGCRGFDAPQASKQGMTMADAKIRVE